MSAIYKRELRGYFTNPIGYVFIAVLLFFEGMQFYTVLANGSSAYFTTIYGSIFTWCMMLIPILTMRLLSEDKKQKTDQALLTAPVSLGGLVFGKFLAAFTVYAIVILFTLIPAFIISFLAVPSWGEIFGNILGSLLYGGAMIAIGLFISSLTDSQMIAAVASFAVSILLIVFGQIASLFGSAWLTRLVSNLSFYERYYSFTTGVCDFSSVVFFLSVIGVFNYLAVTMLEKKRWS